MVLNPIMKYRPVRHYVSREAPGRGVRRAPGVVRVAVIPGAIPPVDVAVMGISGPEEDAVPEVNRAGVKLQQASSKLAG